MKLSLMENRNFVLITMASGNFCRDKNIKVRAMGAYYLGINKQEDQE